LRVGQELVLDILGDLKVESSDVFGRFDTRKSALLEP
jgi:hypothetical protein